MKPPQTLGIGGEIPLPPLRRLATVWLRDLPERSALSIQLASGRDAIAFLLKLLVVRKDDQVLLPSYLCPEMLEPLRGRADIRFYRIDDRLRIDISDLEAKMTGKSRVVFVIHYFGFPQDRTNEIAALCEQHDISLVEDCVQSSFSRLNGRPLGSLGAASFDSPRKYLGVADGSTVSVNDMELANQMESVRILPPKNSYVMMRYSSLLLQAASRQPCIRPNLLIEASAGIMYSLAERVLDSCEKPRAMSAFSRKILQQMDYQTVISLRRRNFLYLIKRLPNQTNPVYENLPDGVCPLGLPILVAKEERDSVRLGLQRRRIYPSIHWRLPREIRNQGYRESCTLSDRILTIPIDQRYSIEEMEYVAQALCREID